MSDKVFDEEAFDEFLQTAMKYTGPPKYLCVLERLQFDNGVVFEPGNYRLTINGYEQYNPEEI